MKALENGQDSPEVAAKARRAKRIIIWVMAILILLPFVLVWFSRAVTF